MSLPTKRVKAKVNVVLVSYLDALLATGLWGTTREEVLERLAAERVAQLVKDGMVRKRVWCDGKVMRG